jgi:periplasmic mercuric ion binding protein
VQTPPTGREFNIFEKTPGMKNIQLLLLALTITSMGAFAQVKKTVLHAVIKTPSVQGELCKTRIETALMREEGINKVVVDWKKKTTKVSYQTDRTNIENIKTAIANAGYDADDVTADREAYERLPKACKKPEDGGIAPRKKY